MDIKAIKRAAKAAARSGAISYQEALNQAAREASFTHWGALLQTQPKPSLVYRYNPLDEQNARDLQQARTDRVHIVYVAQDMAIATGHVVLMANSAAKLPTPEQAKGLLIPRPAAFAVVDEGLSRDWADIPRITCAAIADMPSGTVVYAERLEWHHVEAARGAGVMLVGAITPGMAKDWPDDAAESFLTVVIPTQDSGQIGRIYSKEEQAIIYATTSVKYVLPQNDEGTVSLLQDRVGATTIRSKGDRPSTPRFDADELRADESIRRSFDVVYPGAIAGTVTGETAKDLKTILEEIEASGAYARIMRPSQPASPPDFRLVPRD